VANQHPYEAARLLAYETREKYGLTGPCVKLSQLKAIYKKLGVKVTYWPYKFSVLRGIYINDDLGPTVMVFKGLPDDPKIFTLGHELKHHLVDNGVCSTIDNDTTLREVAAEVFAAELLLPEELFTSGLEERGVKPGENTLIEVRHALVRLKKDTGTTLSYTGLAKRADRLGYVSSGALIGTKWKKLEEELYGLPFYKRRVFARARNQ
jgi:IrrE N-terminal-like domain